MARERIFPVLGRFLGSSRVGLIGGILSFLLRLCLTRVYDFMLCKTHSTSARVSQIVSLSIPPNPVSLLFGPLIVVFMFRLLLPSLYMISQVSGRPSQVPSIRWDDWWCFWLVREDLVFLYIFFVVLVLF